MPSARSTTRSICTECSSGFQRGPSRPGFAAHGPFASELATQHTASQGDCLKVLCLHSAEEPETARYMTPAIRPATGNVACRGRPSAGCAEPAAQPARDGAAVAWRGEGADPARFFKGEPRPGISVRGKAGASPCAGRSERQRLYTIGPQGLFYVGSPGYWAEPGPSKRGPREHLFLVAPARRLAPRHGGPRG